jgi:hypothetical protein
MTASDPEFNVRQLTSTISVNPDHVVSAQITMSRRKAQAGPTRWQIEIATTAGGNPLVVEDSEGGFKELAKQLQLDIPAAPYEPLGTHREHQEDDAIPTFDEAKDHRADG